MLINTLVVFFFLKTYQKFFRTFEYFEESKCSLNVLGLMNTLRKVV